MKTLARPVQCQKRVRDGRGRCQRPARVLIIRGDEQRLVCGPHARAAMRDGWTGEPVR